MKKVISRVVLFVLIGFLAVCFGCGSNKLTREKAKEMIVKKFEYPREVRGAVKLVKGGVRAPEDAHIIGALRAFEKEKLVKFRQKQSEVMSFITISDTVLTEEGRKYAFELDGGGGIGVLLCKEQFVGITGITFPEGKNQARVEWTYKYEDITPFAKHWSTKGKELGKLSAYADPKKNFNTELKKKNIKMALYDDGWRIAE